MDYGKFCTQILETDSKIRFAAVYDEWSNRIAGGLREGIESLLPERQEKELVNLSVFDWKARRDMSKTLGIVSYTMAEYEKVKRFSFYLGEEHLLLVSSEKDNDTSKVADEIIKIYHEN